MSRAKKTNQIPTSIRADRKISLVMRTITSPSLRPEEAKTQKKKQYRRLADVYYCIDEQNQLNAMRYNRWIFYFNLMKLERAAKIA